jgi:hypothetical protein
MKRLDIWSGLVVIGGLMAAPAVASAAGRTLQPQAMSGVHIDGLLREWGGRMTPLDTRLRGGGGAPRVSTEVGFDDQNLYVALRIHDNRIVRTRAASGGEDHATLFLALPRGRGYATHQVQIFPGNPGKVAGVVKMGGRKVPGALAVEAPIKGGLDVEAKIPWSTFREARRVRVGMRAAIEYSDADSPGAIKAIVGTSGGRSGRSLPPMRLEGEQGLYDNLVHARSLPSEPARAAYGNVAGDGMLERVAIYGSFLTIVGPHYRGGKQFYFGDLGVAGPSGVKRFELEDLDGDGRDEIVIQKNVGTSDKYRGVFEVFKVGRDDSPFQAFAHEVAIVTPEGRIENSVRLEKKGRGYAIQISQDKAEGFDPGTYKEPTSDDMPSALLPWQTVGSQTYTWNGSKFVKSGETTHTPHASSSRSHKKAAGPPPPPAPRPPTSDELLDRVYALYRKERHMGRAKPRFDFVTDVIGDRRTERVLVHKKDIVVFGKGFRGGTSYAYITIGVADPKDILDVTARDLTGDGKAEIVVRGVLHAKASKELGGDVVERDALFVYKVTDGGIHRIFAAETGRALGDDRIIGTVAFRPAQQGLSIVLGPGRAVGWTEKDYPFPVDTTAAGGLEPLALPWSGSSPRSYQYDGSAYAAR